MLKKQITVLLPYYLHDGYKWLFEELGYSVIWADNKEELEEKIRTHKIDIALEWQHGRYDFTILNLVRKYDVDVPALLMLNWNGAPPYNFDDLDYADTIAAVIDFKEFETKVALYTKKQS